MYLGTGIALTNWLSAFIITAAAGLAYLYRVRVEEQGAPGESGQPLSGIYAPHQEVRSLRFLMLLFPGREISTPAPRSGLGRCRNPC
jgi:hypothetical protein